MGLDPNKVQPVYVNGNKRQGTQACRDIFSQCLCVEQVCFCFTCMCVLHTLTHQTKGSKDANNPSLLSAVCLDVRLSGQSDLRDFRHNFAALTITLKKERKYLRSSQRMGQEEKNRQTAVCRKGAVRKGKRSGGPGGKEKKEEGEDRRGRGGVTGIPAAMADSSFCLHLSFPVTVPSSCFSGCKTE